MIPLWKSPIKLPVELPVDFCWYPWSRPLSRHADFSSHSVICLVFVRFRFVFNLNIWFYGLNVFSGFLDEKPCRIMWKLCQTVISRPEHTKCDKFG